MSSVPNNPTVNIESGHVLKNVSRVEDIHARMEVRVEANVRSWEVGRILRRDFNLLTSRMYKAAHGRDQKMGREIRNLTMDLVLQGEFFKADSDQFNETHEFPIHSTIPLRIISPEANLVLRTLLAADAAMMRYQCAVLDGVLDREVRQRKWNEFTPAYYDLKNFILNSNKSGKTAAQLSEELGIG